jgi:hypothetical protein
VFTCRNNFGAFPTNPLQVYEVPQEDGLALQQVEAVATAASTGFMERAMGIEPTSEAWEVFEDLHSLLFPRHVASSMRKLIAGL